ncbi:MAG: transporter [Pseudomonadota bacterium]
MDVSGITYGSDISGLVWGFLFEHDKTAVTPVGANVALGHLNGDLSQDTAFIWLHFNLSNAASEKWLRSNLKLSDEFYESLHQGSRSTRIEVADDSLIGVVNDVRHDFSYDAPDTSALWIHVTQNLVVSARRAPLQSVERLRQAVMQGEPIRSSVELLIHLLRDQADVLARIVRDAVEQIDNIEDSLLAGRLAHRRETLGVLRRVLVRLRRLLAPEPASLFRLLQKPPAWMADADTQDLRQSTEEFSAELNDMSSLNERIKLLQEELAARVEEENGRSLFVLTIVTVLALPINIVAGLLGMNVGGVPLAQHPNGFWLVVATVTGTTIAAGLILARLQKRR